MTDSPRDFPFCNPTEKIPLAQLGGLLELARLPDEMLAKADPDATEVLAAIDDPSAPPRRAPAPVTMLDAPWVTDVDLESLGPSTQTLPGPPPNDSWERHELEAEHDEPGGVGREVLDDPTSVHLVCQTVASLDDGLCYGAAKRSPRPRRAGRSNPRRRRQS